MSHHSRSSALQAHGQESQVALPKLRLGFRVRPTPNFSCLIDRVKFEVWGGAGEGGGGEGRGGGGGGRGGGGEVEGGGGEGGGEWLSATFSQKQLLA